MSPAVKLEQVSKETRSPDVRVVHLLPITDDVPRDNRENGLRQLVTLKSCTEDRSQLTVEVVAECERALVPLRIAVS